MATQLLPMVVGATRPQLSFDACMPTDQGGGPADLTGHTIEIALLQPDGTKSVRLAIPTNPTGGQVTFSWQPGDFPLAGKVQSQIIITYPDGGILKQTGPTFDVKPAFG